MKMKLSLPKSKNPLVNLAVTNAAIAVGAALVLGLFVIKPLMHRANVTSAQLSIVNKQNDALRQLDKDTQTLRQNYQAVASQSQQLLNLLPPQSQEERLLALLSHYTAVSGVVMNSFSPVATATSGSAAAPVAGLTVYGASISVTGSYSSLQTFFKNIEAGSRYIDVTTTSLSTGSQGNTLSAGVSLQAYYQTTSIQPTTGATK